MSQKLAAVLLCASLAACSASDALKLISGGGPNVAANTNIGKTNTQTVGKTNIAEQKIVRPQARKITQSADDNNVRAEKIGTLNLVSGLSWIEAFVMAWLLFLDSPRRWPGQIIEGFRKRKRLRSGRS